jgi:hypothetical protein
MFTNGKVTNNDFKTVVGAINDGKYQASAAVS